MQDLETAKKTLYDKQLTLVIVKNGQALFQTDSHRISGFIKAIDTLGQRAEWGFSCGSGGWKSIGFAVCLCGNKSCLR